MSYLSEILEYKKIEVAELRSSTRYPDLRACATRLPPTRGFRAALDAPDGPHLIAELKKASPSKGLIRPDYEPVCFARRYEACGAAAISCLTDRAFFQGSLDDLERVREAVHLPILRKDFIIDECQVHETRAAGADALLLIIAALDTAQLEDLSLLAAELGLDVLVEVHEEEELECAFASAAPPRLLGINNRSLATFTTDLATTERLAPLVPEGVVLVGESGIVTRGDVERLGRAGVHAVLVGETLMRRTDPGDAVRELLGAEAAP